MDPLTISYEWTIPVQQDDGSTVNLSSFTSRLTQAQVDDYLSRYTDGQPVDPADAQAYFTSFMAVLYASLNP